MKRSPLTPVEKFAMACAEAGHPADIVDSELASWEWNRGVPFDVAKRAEALVADSTLHLGFIPSAIPALASRSPHSLRSRTWRSSEKITITSAWIGEP